MDTGKEKLIKSLDNLKDALAFYKNAKAGEKEVAFLSLSKAFEVAVEYSWRKLKMMVEDEGLEAPSPKSAIREAARLNIIRDAESWIDFINARNAGVHDYFGMSKDEYYQIARNFLEQARKVFNRKGY